MPKNLALFGCVVLALAGANVMDIWARLTAFLFTNQLPSSLFFIAIFWIWFATAALAAWCGLLGGYQLLRNGDLRHPSLTVFVIASCLVVKVSGQELGYSAVRLAVNLGIAGFYLGVNILGFVFWWWLAKLRRSLAPQRTQELESARGHGAV